MRPATLMICILSTSLLSTAAISAVRPSTVSLGGRFGSLPNFIPTSFHPGDSHGFGHGWGHSGGDWGGGHDHGHGWGWGDGWHHGGGDPGWGGGGHPCSP
jgi:hypothetical protein